MAADDFTQTRSAWVEHMARSRALGPPAFRCGYMIGTYMNRRSREAWPSRERLAADLGISQRAVTKAVHELVAAGYLDIIPAHPGQTNRYRMRMGEQKFSHPGKNGRTKAPKRGNKSTKMGERMRQNGGTKVPSEPSEEPVEEPLEEPFDSKKGKKSAPTSIPKNWPSEEDKKWAQELWWEQGRPDLAERVDDVAAQCRDKHQGMGTRAVDWSALWQSWARRPRLQPSAR